jgi:5'-3' exonuclease
MKYLLIDGNNLGVRNAFANAELTNSDGVPTGVHYGFFNSLVKLKDQFDDRQFLVVWDGKSKRRIAEAQAGVESGLVPSGYKENRKEKRQELQDFYAQLPFLRKGIHQAGIPQIQLPNFEADDVVSSYCAMLRDEHDVMVVTSDGDYFQLLHDNVTLWDGMKDRLTEKAAWEAELKITPDQYVDVGALMGDTSDNIFGIPGWGEKTALKAIQKSKDWRSAIKEYHDKYDSLRVQFPDLTDEDEFKRLAELKTKSEKPKYPEISLGMPFTGVALAIEDKKTKSIPKTALMALIFENRVELAYSLKKMDDNIDGLPEVVAPEFNRDRLVEYFDYYDITTLRVSVDVFKRV